jgi:hypothetical protein
MIAQGRSRVPPPRNTTFLALQPASPIVRGTLLQRACSCGGPAGLAGECDECRRPALGGHGLATPRRVSEPGDVHEREADRIADAVITGADRPEGIVTPFSVQRLGAATGASATAPASVGHVLSSPGHPLDAATRAFFEPRFGHDFGQVRVHTDARAADSARELEARAYTVGRDVVFGEREYRPGSPDRRLCTCSMWIIAPP